MAITQPQKSRTVRVRDKNPPKLDKPRAKPGPKAKNAPRTAARFEKDERREDLTFSDWVQVFEYMEEHGKSQKEVSAYFATRPDAEGGKLLFTQSALSKKLKKKEEIRALVAEDPNALSMKRAPSGCEIWSKKKRTVTGAMLIVKRRRFEEALKIPEERRLTGNGWLESFKKA
ncbi:hypothetical protein B0H13DRAFT_1859872 [Mycena leptocephala]|nr:hypothetical protein B0H13DRAFT_1859872 [Mycena leptocephala]